jgi:TfoX/Sxy family transcriptional regulator of competence genes
MPYDHGLAERVADVLPTLGAAHARQKNVFGGRGFLLGKSTFVVVLEDGLLLKLTPADYPGALTEPGVTPFAPNGERPMSTWVVVPADAVADDPELGDWLERALQAVR